MCEAKRRKLDCIAEIDARIAQEASHFVHNMLANKGRK